MFLLTIHINKYRFRCPPPELILSCTVILSRVRGLDGAEDELWFFTEQFLVPLVPGVFSFWVSITATGQSHWIILHNVTRESPRHRERFRSIWRRWYDQTLIWECSSPTFIQYTRITALWLYAFANQCSCCSLHPYLTRLTFVVKTLN